MSVVYLLMSSDVVESESSICSIGSRRIWWKSTAGFHRFSLDTRGSPRSIRLIRKYVLAWLFIVKVIATSTIRFFWERKNKKFINIWLGLWEEWCSGSWYEVLRVFLYWLRWPHLVSEQTYLCDSLKSQVRYFFRENILKSMSCCMIKVIYRFLLFFSFPDHFSALCSETVATAKVIGCSNHFSNDHSLKMRLYRGRKVPIITKGYTRPINTKTNLLFLWFKMWYLLISTITLLIQIS